jgi:hypothetical protein
MINIPPTQKVVVCFFPYKRNSGSVLIFSWSSAPSKQAFYFSSIVIV